jgi:hypothetical protein
VKPAASFAVVTILAILTIAEVIALADTTNYPPLGPATAIPGHQMDPPQIPITSPNWVPDHGSLPPKSLEPGIYEVKPYAIMLKAPDSTSDNCVLRNSSPSPMPIQHPELEVIPKVMPVSSDKK